MPSSHVIHGWCLVLAVVAVSWVARVESGLSPAGTAAAVATRRARQERTRPETETLPVTDDRANRPPWAVRRNVRRETPRTEDAARHDEDAVEQPSSDRRLGRHGRSSSAGMFVRSTYTPFRRPISFPESDGHPEEQPTEPPPSPPTPEHHVAKRKRVKLIRFIDNEGNVENVETQTVAADVAGNDLLTPTAPAPAPAPRSATPRPDIEEGAASSKREGGGTSSNSLLDIGKPGNPYELIQVAFPPHSRVKPHAVTTNELAENDLEDFDPSEIYFTDGNLLVLRGGSWPKNYKPADPGPPIDDYRAPFREPKLPPSAGGLEFGGPPTFIPPYQLRPGQDPFGGPPDPLALNITPYDLCPLGGPCEPLLFPPLIGEHPPPDGVSPIFLIHPDVKVTKLREKPAKSVYPSDADRYTYYAVNYGKPKTVPGDDVLGGVEEELRKELKGFFPPPNSAVPESVGTPILSNVPPLLPTPAPRPPRPPTAFPPRPPRPTKPPKKILFPGDEMFEFPEIVTRRPKPSKRPSPLPGDKRPIFFPQAAEKEKRPPTKYELYQNLAAGAGGAGKVSPWVPRLSRRPDGTLAVDPSQREPQRGGPNPNFAASALHQAGPPHGFRHHRPNAVAADEFQPAYSEDFGTTYFQTTTTTQATPTTTQTTSGVLSLEHDVDVNYKQPLPPVNPQSETLGPPRFTRPLRVAQFGPPVAATPFEAALRGLQTAGTPFFSSTPLPPPTAAAAGPFVANAIAAASARPPVIPQLVPGPLHARAFRLPHDNLHLHRVQQQQQQQQSAPFVRYLFQLGPPSARPLINYTQFLGRKRRK